MTTRMWKASGNPSHGSLAKHLVPEIALTLPLTRTGMRRTSLVTHSCAKSLSSPCAELFFLQAGDWTRQRLVLRVCRLRRARPVDQAHTACLRCSACQHKRMAHNRACQPPVLRQSRHQYKEFFVSSLRHAYQSVCTLPHQKEWWISIAQGAQPMPACRSLSTR